MATSSNAFVDEQAVVEMALCTDLFDHIDDLLNFPADDSDVPSRSHNTVADVIAAPFPDHPADDDIGAALFGRHSSAASDDHLLAAAAATAFNQGDHNNQLGPCDDGELADELDWLSNFLDDSTTDSFALHLPDANPGKNKKTTANSDNGNSLFRTPSPVSVLEPTSLGGGSTAGGSQVSSTSPTSSSSSSSSFVFGDAANFSQFAPPQANRAPPTHEALIIPGRARTKRPRPAAFSPRPSIQQQAAVIIPNLTPAIQPEAVPLSAITAALRTSDEPESFGEHEPPTETTIRKKKKRPTSVKDPPSFLLGGDEGEDESGVAGATAAVRKCMHCEITKTPQWRAGPMGPKTLCNACGVRYKSGRLFPEYRPAASPTYVPSVHSNSHKKIVEMRIKESQRAAAAGVPVPDNPAAKGCDLLQFIRRRESSERSLIN